MNSAFADTLIEALAALEAGQSIEEILATYPAEADTLRPALETMVQLSQLPVAHSLAAQADSRAQFLRQASVLRTRKRPPAVAFLRRFLSRATVLASLAVFIVVLGGLLTASAQKAFPGHPLYPLKRTIEGARLSLASGPAEQAALQAEFRTRRREELYVLLAQDRVAEVECGGEIEVVSPERWTLSGLAVQITDTTTIVGQARTGATAWGRCRVADGQVLALNLTVEKGGPALPEPSPTPTLTATPTDTPSATPTASATVTATPSPTLTPTATLTPTLPPPAPTATSLPAPATSTGDDEEEEEAEEEAPPEEEEEKEEEDRVKEEEEEAEEAEEEREDD